MEKKWGALDYFKEGIGGKFRRLVQYSQANGDLSENRKQMKGDLRRKCIYTNGDLRYIMRFGLINKQKDI